MKARELCNGHYHQWSRGVELHPLESRWTQRGKTCIGPRCDRPATVKDMCRSHYVQWNRHGKLFVLEPRRKRS